jgi:hypothetical protein
MSIDISFLEDALKTVRPGDTILLKDGNYANQNITIAGSGTETNPIIIQPDNQDGITLSGTTRITVTGDHIIMRNFLLKGIDELKLMGTHCRLTDNRITAKHFIIQGKNNRLDHNIMIDIQRLTISESYNILDYNDINRTHVHIKSQHNTIHKNNCSNTMIYNYKPNNVIASNSFTDKGLGMVIETSDTILYNNSFKDGEEAIQLASASNTIIAENTFHGNDVCIKLKDFTKATISDNHFIHCNSIVYDTAVPEDSLSVEFTNNKIYNDGISHDFPRIYINYSSNVHFTSSGSVNQVEGIIEQHIALVDFDNVKQQTIHHGHDESHVGLLTNKNNIDSTQLFKCVETFHHELRDSILDKLGLLSDIPGTQHTP